MQIFCWQSQTDTERQTDREGERQRGKEKDRQVGNTTHRQRRINELGRETDRLTIKLAAR